MSKNKDKKANRQKIIDNVLMGLFIIIIITVLITFRFSNNYINHYMDLLQEGIERRLLAECRTLMYRVPVSQLNEYHVAEDMNRPDYIALREELAKYAEDNGLMYVYFMRMVNGKLQYIIDSDPNPETHYGLDFFEENPYKEVVKAFNGQVAYNRIGDYMEDWEGILSAFVPVYDEYNNVVAVVGADVSDEEIVKRQEETQIFTYISGASAGVLGFASILFIIRYRRKAKAAFDASIAKSQFLSRMSHEIRTPMNAIIGFCRMAKKEENLDKKSEYIDHISTSSDYLLELINGILDISKIEASKMILSREKASPYKIMQDINVILASQVTKKSQTFTIDIADNIPKYVYCDETKLTQIIVNLSANAIKFTPEKGKITIKVSLLKKQDNTCNLEFIIQDSGIGIEEEAIAKLFEPFEQADNSITRKYGGTGLGLAISKLFVEMMKGTISVTSKIGEGSAFKFDVWLDIVPDDEVPKEEGPTAWGDKSDSKEAADYTGLTFLVAEDNDINQIIIKDLLEGFGATTEFAKNGIQCIDKYTQNPDKYKIIFMDIQMPEMDGLEATRKIRESGLPNAKEIPIIALTAEVFQEDINNALNAGMNNHLGKPLNIEEVKKAIKEALKKEKMD